MRRKRLKAEALANYLSVTSNMFIIGSGNVRLFSVSIGAAVVTNHTGKEVGIVNFCRHTHHTVTTVGGFIAPVLSSLCFGFQRDNYLSV